MLSPSAKGNGIRPTLATIFDTTVKILNFWIFASLPKPAYTFFVSNLTCSKYYYNIFGIFVDK
jgi:hypothetical protein